MEILNEASSRITVYFTSLLKKARPTGVVRQMTRRLSNMSIQSRRIRTGQSNLSQGSKESQQALELLPRSTQQKASPTLKSSMKMSVNKNNPKKSKPGPLGFGSLLKEIKSTENEQSTSRQKKIIQFLMD